MIDTDTLKRMKFIEPLHRNGKVQSYQIGWNDAIDSIIENAPTIDAEPKHGHWIEVWENDVKNGTQYSIKATCSNCKKISKRPLGEYCKWCGARMNGQSYWQGSDYCSWGEKMDEVE